MPEVGIVDAHVHLWDPRRFRMPWLDSSERLNRPYGLADYAEATRGLDVQAMVYVEVDVAPHVALLEARWAVERAAEDPRLQGVVPHAPLEYGEQVRAYLDALVALGPRVKGVRRLLQGEPDPAFCLRPDFVKGVRLLAEYGLSFEACVVHPQLGSIVELARRCPETRIILDHLGKPGIREGLLDPWRTHIRELAMLPNVFCKVSGVVTEADQQAWRPDDLAPYVRHVLESFGEERVLFGGDWPVVLLASPYARWVETLGGLTRDLSSEARRKLWADNARRCYRLG